MEIESTSDVSLDLLHEVFDGLTIESEPTHVAEYQAFFKSLDRPSWVLLLNGVPTWVKVLAAVYAAELVKQSAKATWRSVAPLLKKGIEVGNLNLTELAARIARLRIKLEPETTITVGVIAPETGKVARFSLRTTEKDMIEVELALLGYYLPVIAAFLASKKDQILDYVAVDILEGGGLVVHWWDATTRQYEEKQLSENAT